MALTDPSGDDSSTVSKTTFLFHMFQIAELQNLKPSAVKAGKVDELWRDCGGGASVDLEEIEKKCAVAHDLLNDLSSFFDYSKTKGRRLKEVIGDFLFWMRQWNHNRDNHPQLWRPWENESKQNDLVKGTPSLSISLS